MTPCDGDGRGVCERPLMNSICAASARERTPHAPRPRIVDVVVPVYDEEHVLHGEHHTRLC